MRSGTRSCGRRGPASDGSTVARSSSTHLRVLGSSPGRARAVLLAVGLDERDLLGGRPVRRRYASVSSSTGKKPQVAPYSGDMFPIVARSASGSAGEAVAEELDELADDAHLAQHLGDREDEVGGRGALRQPPRQPEADDLRDEHRDRLAEHRRLGLDAADAPAEHAEAVDHRRVRVGADERVREGTAVSLLDDAGEVLEVDLVDDARVRRHDLEVPEARLAPAQESVALAVALELELGVAREGDAVPNSSTWTEWSITSSAGSSGLIARGRRRARPSRRASRPGRRSRARR